MSDTQEMTVDERPALSNLAGGALTLIILALAAVIWYQQTQLSKAVETLAVVSAKCAAASSAKK